MNDLKRSKVTRRVLSPVLNLTLILIALIGVSVFYWIGPSKGTAIKVDTQYFNQASNLESAELTKILARSDGDVKVDLFRDEDCWHYVIRMTLSDSTMGYLEAIEKMSDFSREAQDLQAGDLLVLDASWMPYYGRWTWLIPPAIRTVSVWTVTGLVNGFGLSFNDATALIDTCAVLCALILLAEIMYCLAKIAICWLRKHKRSALT